MGLHEKSDREKRKRKYAEQFTKTAENKRRKTEKRKKKFGGHKWNIRLKDLVKKKQLNMV